MLSKGLVEFGITATGFFLLGNGVSGIVKDRPYAITQTAVSVAGLGFYYARKYASRTLRTKQFLGEMFNETTFVSKKGVYFVKNPSDLKNFFTGERKIGQYCEVSGEDFDRYVKGNLAIFLSEIISFAIHHNLIKGKTIKESVLLGIYDTIEHQIPDFLKKRDIPTFVNENRVVDVYALKMCHEIFKNVEVCQNEEAVLNYLKNGFKDKTSPFYDLIEERRLSSFLNRDIYSSGCENRFKFLNGLQYATLTGAAATATMEGVISMPFLTLATASLAGGVAFYNYSQKAKHWDRQFSRFDVCGFELKEVQVERTEQLCDQGYIGWYEKRTSLTKLKRAKIDLKMQEKVISLLKESPFKTTNIAGRYLLQQVMADEGISPVYRAIEKGATIESAVARFGIERVYQSMWFVKFANDLIKNEDRLLHSLIFKLESTLVDKQQEIRDARTRMSKRAYEETQAILSLYEEGFISSENKRERLCRIFDFEDRGTWYFVPEKTKLPKKINQIMHASVQTQKEYE